MDAADHGANLRTRFKANHFYDSQRSSKRYELLTEQAVLFSLGKLLTVAPLASICATTEQKNGMTD
jgi:hypothetical protein